MVVICQLIIREYLTMGNFKKNRYCKIFMGHADSPGSVSWYLEADPDLTHCGNCEQRLRVLCGRPVRLPTSIIFYFIRSVKIRHLYLKSSRLLEVWGSKQSRYVAIHRSFVDKAPGQPRFLLNSNTWASFPLSGSVGPPCSRQLGYIERSYGEGLDPLVRQHP